MRFKLLIASLALVVVAESVYILVRTHPFNRFKPVEEFGYGVVALDTATGQLCKTLRTRPVAEIENSDLVPAKKAAPCTPPPAPSGDSVLDSINRLGISKACGGTGEDVTQRSEADSTVEVVAKLPACVDIR